MTRYLVAVLIVAVVAYTARRVNARIRATMPARPTPLTLAERYDAEMMWDDGDDPLDAA